MSASYQEIFEDVKNDRHSGAWVVARKTIATEIFDAQPGMAQLINLFNGILNTIEKETSNDALVLSRKIAGEARRFDELAKNAVDQVSKFGADLIGEDAVVFIHSNSSTILEILKKTKEQGKTFQVILTEARPICEGRACAEALSKLGIQNLYLFDAAISKGIERADIVLLGADSLSETELVNKIGTRAIGLLAKEAVVPCYAACESSKFMPQKLRPKKEPPRDPNEVWDQPPAETTIENYYLDEVPLDLFTGIITEEGVLTPEEAGSRIRGQKLNVKLLEMLK